MGRLPRGRLGVGEVVVALGGGSAVLADAAAASGTCYRPLEGVEYRVMRLEDSVDGDGGPAALMCVPARAATVGADRSEVGSRSIAPR